MRCWHSASSRAGSGSQFFARCSGTPCGRARDGRCYKEWRPDRESNPGARICSPLRHHSAIGPRRAQMRGFAGVVKRRSRFLPFRRSVVGMLLGKKPGTARAGKLPGEIVLDHRASATAADAHPPAIDHARMPSGANMISRRATQQLHQVHLECPVPTLRPHLAA